MFKSALLLTIKLITQFRIRLIRPNIKKEGRYHEKQIRMFSEAIKTSR